MEMYTVNLQQIDNFLNANREIQQTVGNLNDPQTLRNNRRHYVLSEYSIETLQTMYNQNAAHIERFMTLNREIQRAIINSVTPVNTPLSNALTANNSVSANNPLSNIFTYEFTIPISSATTSSATTSDVEPMTNLLTPAQITQRPSGFYSLGQSLLESLMTPVVVRPTQEQIAAATRRVKYGDISRPVNTTCPISLEPFADEDDVIVIRHCGHIFKPTEFQTWFNTNCRCPTCRYDIRGTN